MLFFSRNFLPFEEVLSASGVLDFSLALFVTFYDNDSHIGIPITSSETPQLVFQSWE